MEKKSIYKKLLEARLLIKRKDTKKDGKNDFAKYDYFTPEKVSSLVTQVCQEIGLLPVFSLKRDELGYYGLLEIIDVETSESITTEMRTEKPSIKATNETQQMGGCETYTKRYMLMSAFDIADNKMDFDNDKGVHPTMGDLKMEFTKLWGQLPEGAEKEKLKGALKLDDLKKINNGIEFLKTRLEVLNGTV
jgi:hypothetical protein